MFGIANVENVCGTAKCRNAAICVVQQM